MIHVIEGGSPDDETTAAITRAIWDYIDLETETARRTKSNVLNEWKTAKWGLIRTIYVSDQTRKFNGV